MGAGLTAASCPPASHGRPGRADPLARQRTSDRRDPARRAPSQVSAVGWAPRPLGTGCGGGGQGILLSPPLRWWEEAVLVRFPAHPAGRRRRPSERPVTPPLQPWRWSDLGSGF